MLRPHTYTVTWFLAGIAAVDCLSVTDIQGASFQSPFAGQTVHNVTGVVTAKDRYGAWIQSERSSDPRVSNGLRVYGSLKSAVAGDLVSLSGRVTEYRARTSPNDLFLTELDSLQDIVMHSHQNEVVPLVLGRDRTPPLWQLSHADAGSDGWLSVPNNASLLESLNPTLQPDKFGLDFWESLEGQLVTVPSPTTVNFADRFGSLWVHGDWPVSGKNSRGGLTIVSNSDGVPSAHPEAIFIGRPLDGSRNPKPPIGSKLTDLTGIVTYQFGYYYILPLTAPSIVSTPNFTAPPASLTRHAHPCALTIGDYNVENMSPRSQHIPRIAAHIATHLLTPDILFVQEIQDDSGTRNNGVVSANRTLSTLAEAIKKASGVHYEYVNVEPLDNMDGGQPGSNIRVAYLWRPERVRLVPGSQRGNATEATQVVFDRFGKLTLSRNPGRIDPTNDAWEEARKPLAAAWQTSTGEHFYTVNVHYNSKRFSSSAQGDARPPVNGRNEQRARQVGVTATFVESLLAIDRNASIVVAGDMNEYLQTRSVFKAFDGLLSDISDSAGVPPEERYTYVYDQNTQEIDHIFVSAAVEARGTQVEHVHVNTWAASVGERASDHDPTVASVWVCDPAGDVVPPEAHGNLYLQNADSAQIVL